MSDDETRTEDPGEQDLPETAQVPESRGTVRGGRVALAVGALALLGVVALLSYPSSEAPRTAPGVPAPTVEGEGASPIAMSAATSGSGPDTAGVASSSAGAQPPARPKGPVAAVRKAAVAPADPAPVSASEDRVGVPAPAASAPETAPASPAKDQREEARPDLSPEQMRRLRDALSDYRAVLGVSEDDETDETEVQP